MLNVLIVFALNFVPLLEARFAIPYGILVLEMSFFSSVLISCIAGLTLSSFLLWFVPQFIWLVKTHIKFLEPLIDKVLERARTKNSEKLALAGNLALITFVAIPLPGSGIFTGSLIAYIFNIPYKRAWILISIGAIVSCVLIGVLTLSGKGLWDIIATVWAA